VSQLFEGSIVARASAVLVVACTLLSRLTAAAQSLGPSPPGYREYLALLGTPIASLPPLGTYTLFGDAQGSPQIAARYGYIADITRPLAPEVGGHAAHSLDSFALTGILSTGLDGTISATAGLSNERCTGCSGSSFMTSVGGDYRLMATSIDAGTAMRLTVGVNGEVGFGNPSAGSTWSADLGLPLALNLGDGSGTSIIPFITPSIAFLSANAGSASDVRAGRLLLGGGVSLFNPKSELGASVGFQYVFVSDTQVQFGVALTLGGR
jgi:hypothetical protein